MAIQENAALISVLIVEDNRRPFSARRNPSATKLFSNTYIGNQCCRAIVALNKYQSAPVLLDLSLPDSSGFNSYIRYTNMQIPYLS